MKCSLGISDFLEEISSLSHPIAFLCFLAVILRKAFLPLLAIVSNSAFRWVYLAIVSNSAFRWVYLSFFPLPFTSLLFTAICKASSDTHFAFVHFFFLGMVSITAYCTIP